MKTVLFQRRAWSCWAIALATLLSGCGSPIAEFKPNSLYMAVQQVDEKAEGPYTNEQASDLRNSLEAMFGTPDDPHVPQIGNTADVLDADLVAMSAGPVKSDRLGRPAGLYREHCAHCHGVTGDGAGPTAAFLNPYPRDYRKGVFKFKSTPKGEKPTHADLKKILYDGINGTAMPSFKTLQDEELDSLVQYVKYLAIRGETERRFIQKLGEEEKRRIADTSDDDTLDKHVATLQSTYSKIIDRWVRAETKSIEIPKKPEWDMGESIVKGRELFYGLGGCVKCHGNSALGDGQVNDYDDWIKEYYDPANKRLVKHKNDFVSMHDAMPPRNIRPRNLRSGIYRGGRRPIDIYWRIRNGIDGTPMPAAPYKEPGEEKKALTADDIWHVVDYVRSLPNESLSRPHIPSPENTRERN